MEHLMGTFARILDAHSKVSGAWGQTSTELHINVDGTEHVVPIHSPDAVCHLDSSMRATIPDVLHCTGHALVAMAALDALLMTVGGPRPVAPVSSIEDLARETGLPMETLRRMRDPDIPPPSVPIERNLALLFLILRRGP